MDLDLSKQRVLVTGGTGFLGWHVIEELKRKGCSQIRSTDRSDADLVDPVAAQKLIEDYNPTVVIHLAAVVGGIGANRENPGSFFFENVVMGVNTVEAARRAGVAKLVAIGTVCAYPKFAAIPFREESLWDGYPEETNAPYGLAKKMLLVQCQSYRQQYGFNGIYLLPVNLYGPRDNFSPESSHVIPALIRKCIEARDSGSREIEVWGTGNATREFLYVQDAAEGIVLATERYDGAQPVNLGAGSEVAIRDLVRQIAQLTGFDGDIRWDSSKPDGQPRRCLDVTRAWETFSFRAKTRLEEGLLRTIDWYSRFRKEQPRNRA